MHRLLWVYIAVHDFGGLAPAAEPHAPPQRPAAWRNGVGRLAAAAPPIVAAGGAEETLAKLDAGAPRTGGARLDSEPGLGSGTQRCGLLVPRLHDRTAFSPHAPLAPYTLWRRGAGRGDFAEHGPWCLWREGSTPGPVQRSAETVHPHSTS